MEATNGTSDNCDWKHWRPEKYICLDDNEVNQDSYAIIILNRPITAPGFAQLWNAATIRCVVDGGMNRFLTWRKQFPQMTVSVPHIFSGDFDSCETEAMEYAKLCGCQIVKTPDQNETDFTKALKTLAPYLKEKHLKAVLTICDTSGRFDQIMANINTMFKSHKLLPDVEVMLMSRNSLAHLLPRGSHIIHIPQYIVDGKLWCGLIPLVCSTLVTTTGFKWNLNNSVMKFGGMVSTSNTYGKDTTEITVKTDNTLLWIMGTAQGDD